MPSHPWTTQATAPADLETLTSGERPHRPVEAIRPGERIGRYIVLSALGAGAMGIVLAAYDPKLDRKVALKLLNPRGGNLERARARLQREAQALARLDHPNVVGVHDVDRHGEQLFVCMEFIAGQTLHEWMAAAASPRPWREVLARFVDAGRGLATAHDAGLIHRDFKPANVMLGDDGRVRVMDFGLARLTPAAVRSPHSLDTPVTSLTKTGASVGTPAYMPPEQFTGGSADARGDQFSFCVSLYEALYGQRPYRARSLGALLRVFASGQIDDPPALTKVPVWLRRALVRGLAPDPRERWPSMNALLGALTYDPTPRRRRRGAAALTVALVVGGAGAVDHALRRDAQACAHGTQKLDEEWNPKRRAALAQVFSSTGRSYAADTWARIEDHLDSYTSDWAAARLDACQATHHGEQSDALLDRRMACLDERHLHLRLTLDELAEVGPDQLQHATKAVLALPDLERCADLDALMAAVPPPDDPQIARQVAALDEQLVEVEVRRHLGEYRQAAQLVDSVVARSEPLGFTPLLARAWLQQGALQHRRAEYDHAEATLKRALDAAISQGMTSEAATATIDLAYLVDHHQTRPQEGRRWAELADSFTRAARRPDLRAKWLGVMGVLEKSAGRLEGARDYYERALSARQQALGPEHPLVAQTLSSLGRLATAAGRYEDARTYQQRALDNYQRTLGPEHPQLAIIFNALSVLSHHTGEYDAARTYAERALRINERALGPEHPLVATSLNLLGVLASTEGEGEQALAHFERALAIRQQALGAEHPDVAELYVNRGNLLQAQGRDQPARDDYQRALDIWHSAGGPEDPHLAKVLHNLGIIAMGEGSYEAAREHFERSLVLMENTLGADHPHLAITLNGLGLIAYLTGDLQAARSYHERAHEIGTRALSPEHPETIQASMYLGRALLGLGQRTEALPRLERAVALEAKLPDPTTRANARFALARALWHSSGDRGRARLLAAAARDALDQHPDQHLDQDGLRREVDAWLSSHPAPRGSSVRRSSRP